MRSWLSPTIAASQLRMPGSGMQWPSFGEPARYTDGGQRGSRRSGGTKLALTLTFERGGGKPVCVAEALYRVFEEDR